MRNYRILILAALAGLLLVQLASVTHLFGRRGGPVQGYGQGYGQGIGRDVTGHWTIALVDTGCPDGCGAALGRLAAAMDRLGPDASRVAPLFISPGAAGSGPPADRRITRLPATPADIERAVAGHGDAPRADGLLVIRQPNGAFAGSIDGAAGAQAIADRLHALLD